MSIKQEAKKLYYKGLSKKVIKENHLNLRCERDSDGIYYMFDDYSNPIFQKGHRSAKAAWAATVKWLREDRVRRWLK